MNQSESIPLEGVLNCWNDDHDLPDLLVSVSRSGKSGRLRFSNPEGDKTLYLREGKFTFAQSSSPDDGLGQYLLRTGKVSLVDYARVSKMVRPGKRLGSLLVKETVLEATDLAPAVVTQVREIILSLFRRTETWYKFEELPLTSKEKITLNLPVSDLVLEGVSRVESWRRVSKGVGQLEDLYQVTGRHTNEWKHGSRVEGVQELLSMLAKPTSLADVCTRSSLMDFEICQYLWGLRVLDWIQHVDAKDTLVDLSKTAVDAIVHPEPKKAVDEPTQPSIAAEASKSRTPIPESLMKTQVAVDASKAAAPRPRDDASTQIAIDTPVRDDSKTQIAVEPAASATRPDAASTQIFDTPATAPPTPTPRSTGEMMESILESDDDEAQSPARLSVSEDASKTRIFDESSAPVQAPPSVETTEPAVKAKSIDDDLARTIAPTDVTLPSMGRKKRKADGDDHGLEHILEDEDKS